MKRINIKSCMGLGVVSLIFFISGCISIPNSPTPRFYTLSAIEGTQGGKRINLPSDVMIGIGPVKIPEYLDRPQIVTKDKEKMLEFAQFDRWAESLDLGLARLIREDLTVILLGPKLTLYPWNPLMAINYQVVIEVVQLDSELDKDMYFAVQWMVIDVQNSKTLIIKRSEFRQPIIPQNYAGLAQTLSRACSSLSGQIAKALAALKMK